MDKNLKEIVLNAKIIALRDVQIALLKEKSEGYIVSDNVFETLRNIEDTYRGNVEDTFTSKEDEVIKDPNTKKY